jgi:hypothetical protein
MARTTVGIIANPASGRDVRRLAARAGTSTVESKRNQVMRAVIGAAAGGAERIVIAKDPLRVSVGAVEGLAVDVAVEAIDVGSRYDAGDTRRAALQMRELGCGALIVLGGDGTNRAIAQAWPDAPIVAISTGTNNAFPRMVEATTAGLAAGLVAAGDVPLEDVALRAKVVRFGFPGESEDLALIDAVQLVDDSVGNLMPFDPERMRTIVLTRADPGGIGVSPVGGLLHPCEHGDDFGVLVRCTGHDGGGRPLLVPISPGLFRRVHVGEARRLALGESVAIEDGGVLALDGDRERDLAAGRPLRLRVVREGPFAIDVARTLAAAARGGLMLDRPALRDSLGVLPGCC